MGAITLEDTGTNVTVNSCVFSNNSQADIYVDCDSTPTTSGNTTPTGIVRQCSS